MPRSPAGNLRHEEPEPGLPILIGFLLAGAAWLFWLVGPPQPPQTVPSWDDVTQTLVGSAVPWEFLAYVAGMAAWAFLLYVAGTVVVQLVLDTLDVLTRGARWLGWLRRWVDRLSLPFITRMTHGAVATVLVVQLVRTPLAATAAFAPTTALHAPFARGATSPAGAASAVQRGPGQLLDAPEVPSESGVVWYTVQRGDSLWSIAQAFYGSGEDYPRIIQANAGRVMRGGGTLHVGGVIYPGWVLRIPLPSTRVVFDGAARYYVVEPGDTLSGIAARLLGDESKYQELFTLNRGARLDDHFVLRDPNLIWPGLRLRLPPASVAARAARGEPPVRPPAEVTAPPAATPKAQTPVSTPQPVATAHQPLATAMPQPPLPTPVVTSATPAPATTEPVSPDGAGAALAPRAPTTPVAPPATGPTPHHGDVDQRTVATGAGLLATVLGLGAAGALTRRRFSRRLRGPLFTPRVGWWNRTASEGFADAEPARLLAARTGDGDEPATLMAQRLSLWLAEERLTGVRLLSVWLGRHEAAVTVSAGLAERATLLERAAAFGAILGVTVTAQVTVDHDVLLELHGLRALPPAPASSSGPAVSCMLVPLGVLRANGAVYFAHWPALGHVLIAGLPGDGPEVVLTSLLAALAARCSPDELALITIAHRRMLPLELRNLPHQRLGFVAPDDEEGVAAALASLRAELHRRMHAAQQGQPGAEAWPRLVLVVGELAALEEDTTLELVGAHGPAHGISMLAATSQPDAIDQELGLFETRIVLQTLDGDQSIRLLGTPEAATLGGGELLLRLSGREGLRARGYRVAPEQLDRLIRLMRASGDAAVSSGGRSSDPGPDHDGLERAGEPPPGAAAPALASDTEPGEASDVEQDVGVAPDELTSDVFPILGEAVGDGAERATPTGSHVRTPVGNAQVGVAADLARATPIEDLVARDEQHGGTANGTVHAAAPSTDGWVAVRPDEIVPASVAAPLGADLPSPVVQVRCFGRLSVTCGGRALSPVGATGPQFKPWQVLVFMAAQPTGSVPKDHLLDALWPSVPVEKATNRLHVTLTRLRMLLAEQVPGLQREVIRFEHDDTYRLDPELVVSDVQQFWHLCQQGRKEPPGVARAAHERAHALYRGDLLAEHLAERKLVGGWMDARGPGGLSLDEQYRREYCRISYELAKLAHKESRVRDAVRYYRSILGAEPAMELAARGLYRCYQHLGDRASLVREHQHLKETVQRLCSESDDAHADPDAGELEPETVQVYEEALASLDAVQPSPRT